MAINQYNISLIPRQPVIDKFREIPVRLFIDHVARQKYITNTLDDNSEYDFRDDLTINWWKNQHTKFADIETYISSFAKPIEWSKDFEDFKSYGDNNDNDLSIYLFEKEYIESFDCRINIAQLNNDFIPHILNIANRLFCLIVDKKGNLFEPTYENIVESIKDSNAFKFCSNPTDFLDKISSGQIKPE